MKPFLVSEIRKVVNGTLLKGSDNLLIIDAEYHLERLNKSNMLFFLKAKRKIDWETIRRCVPCAVITDKISDELIAISSCTIILVKNIHTAYWEFVDFYRNSFQIPVVAVTGTSGKTTTKDMIKHILNKDYKVTGTISSANGRNDYLKYMLRIDETTQTAVFETAIGEPGDILFSCKYFKPTIGVVTNIGVDHLDKCKTVEGYIQAKAEIVTVLGQDGILILNADDLNSKRIGLEKFKGRIVYFGINNPAHFQALEVQYGEKGMEFVLMFQHMKYPMFVQGYGEHQVYNALAALATIHEMGVGINEATIQLRTFENLQAHLQLVPGIGGCLSLTTHGIQIQAH